MYPKPSVDEPRDTGIVGGRAVVARNQSRAPFDTAPPRVAPTSRGAGRTNRPLR
jgi:hypothetical protein